MVSKSSLPAENSGIDVAPLIPLFAWLKNFEYSSSADVNEAVLDSSKIPPLTNSAHYKNTIKKK